MGVCSGRCQHGHQAVLRGVNVPAVHAGMLAPTALSQMRVNLPVPLGMAAAALMSVWLPDMRTLTAGKLLQHPPDC